MPKPRLDILMPVTGKATALSENYLDVHPLDQTGEFEEALEVQGMVYRLAGLIYGRNPWARIKKSLELRGIGVGPPRPPVGACSPDETEKLRTGLVGLGLL